MELNRGFIGNIRWIYTLGFNRLGYRFSLTETRDFRTHDGDCKIAWIFVLRGCRANILAQSYPRRNYRHYCGRLR